MDGPVVNMNMHRIIHGGNHGEDCFYSFKDYAGKGRSLDGLQLQLGAKKMKTKISFQSCRKKTPVLEMTTEENQPEIQIVSYGKSHTPHGVVRN